MEREAKIDDMEFREVMDTLDQNNRLAAEDRDFDERVQERQTRNATTNGEQNND
jgi:hypothetical protein